MKKNFALPQLRFLDAIFMRQFSRRCRHRRLLKTAHDYAQLSTMVDFIVLSIKLVFMVLGVSYSRVFAQRPTGCCSATHGLLLSDSRVAAQLVVNIMKVYIERKNMQVQLIPLRRKYRLY